MADIRRFFMLRHLRGESSSHILHHRGGKTVRAGRGLSFWFLPMTSSISEVPVDDRDQSFVFEGRTEDFQEVITQGVITWRVVDPDRLAERVDFSVDMGTGNWSRKPLEQVAQLLVEVAQQQAWAYLSHASIHDVLRDGVAELRARLEQVLMGTEALAELGIEVVTVRVSSVRPSSDLEKALQTPAREAIQEAADKAMFSRRARAVDQERAIAENELNNEIELAKRKETLIEREGANERRAAAENAAVARLNAESHSETSGIDVEAEAQKLRVAAQAQADASRLRGQAKAASVAVIGQAEAEAKRAMMAAHSEVSTDTLMALALRDVAGQLPSIGQVHLSPDLLSTALVKLVGGMKAEA